MTRCGRSVLKPRDQRETAGCVMGRGACAAKATPRVKDVMDAIENVIDWLRRVRNAMAIACRQRQSRQRQTKRAPLDTNHEPR